MLTQKTDVFGEQDLSQQATAAKMKFDNGKYFLVKDLLYSYIYCRRSTHRYY